MNIKELSDIIRECVESGAGKALCDAVLPEEYLSRQQAYRRFGRTNVDRWLKEELIFLTTPSGKSAKRVICKERLLAIAAGSNRISYLPVADR